MSPRESYPDRITARLQGALAVGDAVATARGFGEGRRLAERDVARLCIVVEELVANLYDHGGLSDDDGVELVLVWEPVAVRIGIADSGRPFDPRSAPSDQQRPDRGGGAGIDLVRAWAQIVGYEATGDGNRLELLLPLGEAGSD